MKVTRIEPAGKSKVQVIIDEEKVFVLKTKELQELGLEEGLELCEAQYQMIYETYVTRPAREKAIDLLSRRDYTRLELTRKLKLAGFPDDAAQAAVSVAAAYGYIDDARYVQNFLTWHTNDKSRKMVFQTLLDKGIDPQLAASCMDEWESDDVDVIRRLYEKKFAKQGSPSVGQEDSHLSPDAVRKIYGYFLRRGFLFQDIVTALDREDL